MNQYSKTREQLASEILTLRRENQALLAQLAFHKKIFKEVHTVLEVAYDFEELTKNNSAFQTILAENEKLKNQLKLLKLSNREQEILKLIVGGYTSKEMANQLSISKLTVDTHRKHIQQKLGVENNVELIKLAMKGGVE